MNIGSKNATGEYLILLNNDTIVDKGWDIELIKTLNSNKNIFAVTPITNRCGNTAMVNIKHENYTDFFNKINEIKPYLASQFDSDSLALFCGCFRLNDFQNIGYFDEKFLNGWEDDDLYERILLLNKKVVISTRSVVYHYANITVGENAYSNDNNSNKLYFEQKWNKLWKTKSNNSFIFNNQDMKEYNPNNNVYEYILENKNSKYLKDSVSFSPNSIEIDNVLYKYLYSVKDNIYKHIHDVGIEKGHIYTVKQLKIILV